MEPETYHLMRQLEDEQWWFVARRRIFESLLRSLDLPARCEILEVGCGTGGNLGTLRKFGNVTGVELDETAAEIADERNVATVLQGGLPDAMPAFSEYFDLVCLFDVLEHVENDVESLQRLSKLLKPSGHIVMTVPAFTFLWSQHDDENHHFRRYRLPEVRRLIQQSGMKLDFASYFNFWLFPPVAAVRLLRKAVPYRKSWGDMRKPPAGINRLLQFVFASERHLVRSVRLPYGMSIIALASPL